MATIRVSGVQMRVAAKKDENLPRILDFIRRSDADFILFPEMSLTGYHGGFSQAKTEQAWEQIAAACRQSYTSVLLGTGAKTDDGAFIQTRIYGSDGGLVGTHEKLVPTDGDRTWCRPGEELRTFTVGGLTFGCLICNDLWVTPGCGPYPDPRLSLQLAQRGARVIFHAVNSGASAAHLPYHESNLSLRAMEGGVYIVTANAATLEGPVNCASGVMGPNGAWVVKVPREGEHIFTADLDIDTETD